MRVPGPEHLSKGPKNIFFENLVKGNFGGKQQIRLFDELACLELPGHERRSRMDKYGCLRVEEFDFEGPGVGKRV